MLGEVHAVSLTVAQPRDVLDPTYMNLYDEPAIEVTPVQTNNLADDIRAGRDYVGWRAPA